MTNTTPTTLRIIIHDFAEEIADTFGGDIDSHPQEHHEHQATQSIKEQLKALLPKYKKGYLTQRGKGFNEAIDQIEKAIDDFCSGKGKEDE